MKVNENMVDTGRMALMLKNGSKVIITRHYFEGNECFLVNISNNIELQAEDGKIDFSNSIIMLNFLVLDDDDLTINGILIENIAIRTVYIINDNGYLDSYEMLYTPEPEEDVLERGVNLMFGEVDRVVTDSAMYNDMFDSNKIDASINALHKYDLMPSNCLIKGDKIIRLTKPGVKKK